jgi:hypothetical protein
VCFSQKKHIIFARGVEVSLRSGRRSASSLLYYKPSRRKKSPLAQRSRKGKKSRAQKRRAHSKKKNHHKNTLKKTEGYTSIYFIARRIVKAKIMGGSVESLHVSEGSMRPMVSERRVTLLPGVGVEGDRYATGTGTYVAIQEPGGISPPGVRLVTLEDRPV